MSGERKQTETPLEVVATTERRSDSTYQLASTDVASKDFVSVDGELEAHELAKQKPPSLPRVIVPGRTDADETAIVKPLGRDGGGPPRSLRWWIAGGASVAVAAIAVVVAMRGGNAKREPEPQTSIEPPKLQQPQQPVAVEPPPPPEPTAEPEPPPPPPPKSERVAKPQPRPQPKPAPTAAHKDEPTWDPKALFLEPKK